MLKEDSYGLQLAIANNVTCKICGTEFTLKECLWRHMKYHKESQKCQCPICLQWFISQTLLNIHMQNHKDRKTFDCPVCGKTLSSKQSYLIHQETHAKLTSNVFQCSLCPKDFPDQRRLTMHMRIHSRNRECCALCPMIYPDKESLKKHTNVWHRKISFQCEICHAKFPHKSYLKIHQNTHREEKSLKCEICKAQFYFSTSLKDHMNKNHGDSTGTIILTCSICAKIFHSAGGLQRHEEAIHQGIRYPCSICPYAAKVKKELDVHMRRHTGEKPFICNICSKTFTTKSDCNTHKKSHDVAKEIMKCQLCHKEVTKHSLKQHMKLKHEGSPSEIHKCEKCGNEFCRKDRLQNHVRHQHDNYKQFVCSVCKKKFNQKVHLKTHMMSHTGEKPFQCLFCDNTFRTLLRMKLHKKSIHETQKYNYKCENCKGTFKTPVVKSHHIVCRTFIYSGTSRTCKICHENVIKNTLLPHSMSHLTIL